MNEKPFAAFYGAKYYPGEGWEDFIGAFATLDEAKERATAKLDMYEWWQVVDLRTLEIAAKGRHEVY